MIWMCLEVGTSKACGHASGGPGVLGSHEGACGQDVDMWLHVTLKVQDQPLLLLLLQVLNALEKF